MSTPNPSIEVAVVMRKERIAGAMSRWQTWRWVLEEVVAQQAEFGKEARLLTRSEVGERWLHPGFTVGLFKDDAEGYYLNASTQAPCWFVLWRMEEEAGLSDEPVAKPEAVSLSYHDAGRWLDAQETVEQVAAAPDVVEWVQAFVEANYVVEPKRRQRPQSFKSLTDRFGNPARVSTQKKFGGGNE
jgi:Protein of unknown function (DUF3305)